jgi:hypothetical protein
MLQDMHGLKVSHAASTAQPRTAPKSAACQHSTAGPSNNGFKEHSRRNILIVVGTCAAALVAPEAQAVQGLTAGRIPGSHRLGGFTACTTSGRQAVIHSLLCAMWARVRASWWMARHRVGVQRVQVLCSARLQPMLHPPRILISHYSIRTYGIWTLTRGVGEVFRG